MAPAARHPSVGTVRTQFFTFASSARPHRLHCSETLGPITLAYETYGKPDKDRSNAILVFHAMTGHQHAAGINRGVPGIEGRWTEENHTGWWDGFIGPGKALDTDKFFVICANYLGGCYGSTGPASKNPATGRAYGASFPTVRMRDIVDSQMKLLDHLKIRRLHACIGGSLGGIMCLILAARYPRRVGLVVPMSAGLRVTTYQKLLNFEQIHAIEHDPNFRGGQYAGGPKPDRGLSMARMIAHKTFVSLEALERRAKRELRQADDDFAWYRLHHPIESYMLHQGKSFVDRFDANTYLRILDAWQYFKLADEVDAPDEAAALARCKNHRFLVFSVDSDVSFHPEEQERLASALKQAGANVMRITVHSDKGHDSFLLEPGLYTPHLRSLLEGL
jgi:homoserine O-acetyltransferase/O-succinyltransferase